MASATLTRSDAELQKLLGLMKQVDSIELKLTIPEGAQLAAIRALGLDPLQAQIRQVFFFDTPDLKLDQNGVVVRARRSQKKGDDTVVKLRPVVPTELPDELRNSPNFGVELDASPTGHVVSGSMKGAPDTGAVRDAMTGGRKVAKLFSKEQRALFADRSPAGIEFEHLHVLGPIFVLKLKAAPEQFERRLVTELWLYPDGSRILELSTKCEPREAFQVAAEARAFLTSLGIDLSASQQTKTRTALDFFAGQLKDGAEEKPKKTQARSSAKGAKASPAEPRKR